jgi:predicted Rossmann fold nucleotide-binding protein DprA/Smf involved in DNA uptake
MKEIQSLLRIMSDGLKMIAQGLEVLSEKVEEIAESQNLVQPRVKKRTPVASTKKVGKKTVGKDLPKDKITKARTAAETVSNLISGSEQGIDVATIMDKTGYDRKKIGNIIYKLAKRGKIKSIQKGVYVKA